MENPCWELISLHGLGVFGDRPIRAACLKWSAMDSRHMLDVVPVVDIVFLMNAASTQAIRDEFSRLLSYDPATGGFRWKVKRQGTRIDKLAGGYDSRGYLKIRIDGVEYLAHRIAWLLIHGAWPNQIDHVNRNKSDNRIENLRDVNGSNNQWNKAVSSKNSTGTKGVCFDRKRGKWMALVSANGKRINLGRFDDESSAVAAVRRKREEMHGTFACH